MSQNLVVWTEPGAAVPVPALHLPAASATSALCVPVVVTSIEWLFSGDFSGDRIADVIKERQDSLTQRRDHSSSAKGFSVVLSFEAKRSVLSYCASTARQEPSMRLLAGVCVQARRSGAAPCPSRFWVTAKFRCSSSGPQVVSASLPCAWRAPTRAIQ